MSHELLTPLNAASLGLKLVSDYTRIVDDEDVHKTVEDINKSIASAVVLLESLSCYEKIDSGIMKIHKQENVPVISFMEDFVYPFSPQARSGGVELILYTDYVRNSSGNSEGE